MENAPNHQPNVNMPMGKANLENLPTITSHKKIMTTIEMTETIAKETLEKKVEIMNHETVKGTIDREIEKESAKESGKEIEIEIEIEKAIDKAIDRETETEKGSEIEIETETEREIGREIDTIRSTRVDTLQTILSMVRVMALIFPTTVIMS